MRQSRVAAVSRLLWKGAARKCNFDKVMVKREPTRISVENILLTKAKGDVAKPSIKSTGAWRYPNHVIQRAPTIRLGSKDYYDDKDPNEARRKHESNFFITLNTNRKCGFDMAGEIVQEGKDACKYALDLLSQDNALCTYIKFGPKSAHYRDDVFEDVVYKVEWQAAVETGENLERLHCHIWLTLHHYSQVQVNMPVMQKMFKDAYNGYGQISTLYGSKLRCNGMPYIQVKLLPSSDWATVMKQYIHKGMALEG